MIKRWVIALLSVLMFTACTKDGDTIYQPDPDEPKASTAPLVTVIYGTDALGDRSYSDLIYKGVEEAAAKYGLRTMQLSPTSYEEGLGYLQSMFQAVKNQTDTIRRLYIVEASSYDKYRIMGSVLSIRFLQNWISSPFCVLLLRLLLQ